MTGLHFRTAKVKAGKKSDWHLDKLQSGNLHSTFEFYHRKHGFAPLEIKAKVPDGLSLVIVIPCHNEPFLVQSLSALLQCAKIPSRVEVIVVVNSGDQDSAEVHAQNEKTLLVATDWISMNPSPDISFYLLNCPTLPQKHAGVGLARKIGMDEAANRLCLAGNPNGIIACFDADSTCQPNYLNAIIEHFERHPTSQACSIRFEHPLRGDFAPEVYEGIVRYELYLRYYRLALKIAGHPHSYHAIGSSMAVRADAYMEQGGMNRRKAGEDFYFLHKYIPLGHFTELNSTSIFPSPRPSDRVPFGTGRAMNAWLSNPNSDYPVFSFKAFSDLKNLLDRIPNGFRLEMDGLMKDLPPGISAFLKEANYERHLGEVYHHTTSSIAFEKRFFRWFNGLQALQYFHFSRDHFYPNESVLKASTELLKKIRPEIELPANEKDMLLCFRKIESESKA